MIKLIRLFQFKFYDNNVNLINKNNENFLILF